MPAISKRISEPQNRNDAAILRHVIMVSVLDPTTPEE